MKTDKEIIKEFRKKYYSKYILNGERIPEYEMTNNLLKDIESFLLQTRKKDREEFKEMLENLRIKEMIRREIIDEDNEEDAKSWNVRAYYFNQAVHEQNKKIDKAIKNL